MTLEHYGVTVEGVDGTEHTHISINKKHIIALAEFNNLKHIYSSITGKIELEYEEPKE